MKIGIVGAGFCGLAVAWHLLECASSKKHLQVFLFDSRGVGLGASGIAAGLLHPFSGAHAKLNWRGHEGVEATNELLSIASHALGRSVIASNQGILRLALTYAQETDFMLCAKKYPAETQWLDVEACQSLARGAASVPGLWIKQGLTVYASLYLQGLWKACERRGVKFQEKKIGVIGRAFRFRCCYCHNWRRERFYT